MLTSITQVHSGGNAVTQEVYDRRGQLVLLIAPNGDRTAFTSDALGQPTAMIESNNALPAATVNAQKASSTSLNIIVAASEPILVAALTIGKSANR